MPEKRGMEAVASKGKRKPAMKRKSGLTVMIAMGGPPPKQKREREMKREREYEEERDMGDESDYMESLSKRIRRLEEAMGIEEEDEEEDED